MKVDGVDLTPTERLRLLRLEEEAALGLDMEFRNEVAKVLEGNAKDVSQIPEPSATEVRSQELAERVSTVDESSIALINFRVRQAT